MTDTHSTIIKELRAEQREMMVKLIDERAEVKRLTERDKVGRELLGDTCWFGASKSPADTKAKSAAHYKRLENYLEEA